MNILDQFESYIFLYKKVSINTYYAYKRDVEEFLSFLATRDRNVLQIQSQDFIDFFNELKKKKLSSSAGVRKASALKAFAQYLHEKHQLPNCEDVIYIQRSFPLMCTPQQISHILESIDKSRLSSYKDIRKYVIVYLLAKVKITINQLVQLRTYHVCSETSTIKLVNKDKTKSIPVASDFMTTLKQYMSQDPFKSSYLFPVKSGNIISSISRQAVWTLLRSLFNRSTNNIASLDKKKRSDMGLDSELLSTYKAKHPRP